jgi:hypothetical protein
MLSTKFGYGRPAAFAIFLAAAFLAGVIGLAAPKDFGRFLSQISFTSSSGISRPQIVQWQLLGEGS